MKKPLGIISRVLSLAAKRDELNIPGGFKMNYNQNQKHAQITFQTLIIGVDIAKFKHVARAQDYRGVEFGKPYYFENTSGCFEGFLTWILELTQKHGMEKTIIGVEPTGHYWLNLAHFLKEEAIKLVVVNPMHVKKSKELDDNSPTKNDVKDAKVIAQLVKDGRYAEPISHKEFMQSFGWQEKYAIFCLLTFKRYKGKFTIG